MPSSPLLLLLFVVIVAMSLADYSGNNNNELETTQSKSLLRLIPSFQSSLQDYINCLVGVYQTSFRSYGIDQVDPLHLTINPTNFDLGFLKGFVELNNLQLEGASNINVLAATLTPTLFPIGAKINAKISWPSINMLAGYNSNITVFGRPLNLNGNTRDLLKALTFDISAAIRQDLTNTKINSLSIKPTLDDSDFNFDGLDLNGVDLGDKLGAVLNQLATFVNTNSDNFDQLVSPFLVDMLNDRLASNDNDNASSSDDVSSESPCQFRFV